MRSIERLFVENNIIFKIVYHDGVVSATSYVGITRADGYYYEDDMPSLEWGGNDPHNIAHEQKISLDTIVKLYQKICEIEPTLPRDVIFVQW